MLKHQVLTGGAAPIEARHFEAKSWQRDHPIMQIRRAGFESYDNISKNKSAWYRSNMLLFDPNLNEIMLMALNPKASNKCGRRRLIVEEVSA